MILKCWERLAICTISSSEEGVKIAEGTFTDAPLHLSIKRLKSSEEGSVKMPVSWESNERRLIAASATGDDFEPIITQRHKKLDSYKIPGGSEYLYVFKLT